MSVCVVILPVVLFARLIFKWQSFAATAIKTADKIPKALAPVIVYDNALT